ncbi:biotin transporter BioY [uncultured Adlercreutzia sp.]|uniref:biotin transporter BioY n=1 Tax=uncultured Adlercreutzia sp. TaxID=875803 RepID=UPI0025CCE7E4|nr:biotin transporter BioY [uncultured Adlercreutzia sp.]MCI9261757.1 biotin transporter BioY [Eggerthellaceae bacterium]
MESVELQEGFENELGAKTPQPVHGAARGVDGVARKGASSRSRSVAFVGLTIALIAASAIIAVPIGPVPITLQMFAITFAIVVLPPKAATAAIVGYLMLGAVGVPVFSGMRGGFGVLAGPTGGFLWGYLLGVPLASLFLAAARKAFGNGGGAARLSRAERAAQSVPQRAASFLRNFGLELVTGIIFTAVAYVCGWAQYMVVAQVGPEVAFLTACAPFIALDLAKIIAAVVCARAVKEVVG